MGLYIEVMCDERKDWPRTPAFAERLSARCWSDRNDSAQGYSVAQSRKEARKQGWVIRGRYACCPGCKDDEAAAALPSPPEEDIRG